MLKKLGLGVLALAIIMLLFLLVSLAPIDETPLDRLDEVEATYSKLDSLTFQRNQGDGVLRAGWSTINITPQIPIHMAGYGPRGPYQSVMDSLYAKVFVLSNGTIQAAIISVDLLMFPRSVKYLVYHELEKYGYTKNNIFLAATHTHNGFGNWDKSMAGEFLFGKFDDENVHYLTNQIVSGVLQAKNRMSTVDIGFRKIDARELVINRLAGDNGTVDPYIRVVSFKQEKGNKALLISYSGHAVNLDADIWILSRDYPGVVVDALEQKDSIDFVMFTAGMVGSHNIKLDIRKGPERIKVTGDLLSHKIIAVQDSFTYGNKTQLAGVDVEINLPPSQLRITRHLRLRDWVFRALMGPLQANIKVLEIGDILLIGMPCDYSGELSVNNQMDQFAAAHGKKLFITSFNGNYVGYITEDNHYYTCDHDEVKVLNWVGPNKGMYFTEIIKKIISRSDS